MGLPRNEIQQLIEQDKLTEAEEHARLLVQDSPQDLEARITLGRVLGLQGKHAEAASVFEQARHLDEQNFEAIFYLGVAYESQKKFDEAIEAYKAALKLGQYSSRVHHRLGVIYNHYEYKGRSDYSARFHLQQATTSEQPIEGAFLELASVETRERAVYVLQNGLRKFPKSIEIYERLSFYLYLLGNYAECIETIASARQHELISDELPFTLGLAYFQLKNYQKSIDAFSEIVPPGDIARNALKCLEGLCLVEMSEYERAQRVLKEVIADDFSNYLGFAGHFILMCCYLRSDNIQNAERVLSEIPVSQSFYRSLLLSVEPYGGLEIDDYFVEALDGLIAKSKTEQCTAKAHGFRGAYAYTSDKTTSQEDNRDFERMRQDLMAALEIWPNNADFNSYLSGVLQELKDWIGSARHYFLSRVCSQEDDYDYSSLDTKVLESIYAARKGVEQLFRTIDRVIEESSYYNFGDRFASRCLGQLIEFLHGKGEHQLVIDLARKFTYKQLLSAEMIFEVAYAYVQIGDNKQGRNYYKAYLRDVGKNSAVANNLSLLEENAGNLPEAERLLQLALEWDASNDKAANNLNRVRQKIKEAEDQKRALQKAADLYLHEPDAVRRAIAELYSQKTSDDLILCTPKKLASLLNLKSDQAERKLSEFIQKKYFEEISDHGIAFDGKVLQTNPVMIPHLQRELEVARENEFIHGITTGLSSESLDKKYGYNQTLVSGLTFVHSDELARMLERDLHEAVVALVTQSHKSALTLCGSIAEAVLLDQLLVQREAAIHALETILTRNGVKVKTEDRQLERWGLDRLLDVALEIKLISTNLYHWGHGIREFRNLVHPGVERRKSIEVSRENAEMAWNVVRRLLKEIGEASGKTT